MAKTVNFGREPALVPKMSATRTSRCLKLVAWPVAALLLIAAMTIIVAEWGVAIRRPWDLAVLLVLSLGTCVVEDFSLPGFQIDVGLVLALAAVVLTGPVGAVIVVVVPELIRPFVERHSVRRIATASNLASFVCAVLVAQAVLLALPTAHATVLARVLTYGVVATAMVLANFVVARGIGAGLVDQVLISGWRTELRALAATLALAPFAALTACLLPSLGILALAAAAAAQAILSVLVSLVTWAPRAGGLTVPEARSRYAAALASRMSLSRSERRVLRAAARSGTGRTVAWLSAGERDRVAKTVILAGLWSRSDDAQDDCFSRLQPAEMGIESRVLLVAHGWAELTAKGTERLEHRLALLRLHNNPRRYDRQVVALARDLIPESDRQTPRARVPHAHEIPRRVAQLKLVA